MTIRVARPEDANGMLEIYGPFVRDTSLTFETEVPTVAAFSDRIAHYLQEYPWLVCEDNGIILGYAYASRYRERTAYQWSVECSVYMRDSGRRKGLAGKLYDSLFALLTMQGFRNVYAVINLPNEPSVAFHEAKGFIHFATYEQVGYKLGRWKNVGWWRKILNDFTEEPPAPVPFRKLPSHQVLDILGNPGN